MDISPHETSSSRMLSGECLCGEVRYRVEDSFLYALNCHCSRCRKATGSAFKPFAGIERSKLSVIGSDEALLIFGDENGHDARCKRCGAMLYSVVRDGQYVHVTLGTLVDTPSIQPTAHIFVDSKAPWYTINDNLPQHQELP
ncbi:GFA family protein [Dyella monticola]|uniref:GFA family protein n=1 Tax=Dyella monticola TaxID=1927958 RepID=A0A370WY94_9GAMM|nr:GFA family protein [Dyella monticola]RDS81124.1 GFA family protein [Dyella monticola]